VVEDFLRCDTDCAHLNYIEKDAIITTFFTQKRPDREPGRFAYIWYIQTKRQWIPATVRLSPNFSLSKGEKFLIEL